MALRDVFETHWAALDRAPLSCGCACGLSARAGIGGRAVFNEVLKNVLASVDGARCVLLAGHDGMVVAAAVAADAPAPDVVAASLADLFRKVATAHRDAGLLPPNEFASGSASGTAALRAVTGEYFLIAVLDGVGSLGQTRFELRKAAAALESELA